MNPDFWSSWTNQTDREWFPTGWTTLLESILYQSGLINKPSADHDVEEKELSLVDLSFDSVDPSVRTPFKRLIKQVQAISLSDVEIKVMILFKVPPDETNPIQEHFTIIQAGPRYLLGLITPHDLMNWLCNTVPDDNIEDMVVITSR